MVQVPILSSEISIYPGRDAIMKYNLRSLLPLLALMPCVKVGFLYSLSGFSQVKREQLCKYIDVSEQ
jgi:hypothetical protein